MGFEKRQDNGEGGFAKFEDGTNVFVKTAKVDTRYRPDKTSNDDDKEPIKYELALTFDAVHEHDPEVQGQTGTYPNSYISVTDKEEFSSNLATLLKKAGVLRDVVEDLAGGDEQIVEAVLNGHSTYKVESEEENLELMQAVARHLNGVVLKASTTVIADEFSLIERFLSKADSNPFEDAGDDENQVSEDGSDSSDEDSNNGSDGKEDVLFGDENADEESDGPEEFIGE